MNLRPLGYEDSVTPYTPVRQPPPLAASSARTKLPHGRPSRSGSRGSAAAAWNVLAHETAPAGTGSRHPRHPSPARLTPDRRICVLEGPAPVARPACRPGSARCPGGPARPVRSVRSGRRVAPLPTLGHGHRRDQRVPDCRIPACMFIDGHAGLALTCHRRPIRGTQWQSAGLRTTVKSRSDDLPVIQADQKLGIDLLVCRQVLTFGRELREWTFARGVTTG